MNRIMMARSVELALGNMQDVLQEGHKACKAKAIGTRVDASLMMDDATEWAKSHATRLRNQVDEGRYAVSDAIDDIDYAIFNDNSKARLTVVTAATAGLAILVSLIAVIKIRHRIRA